MYATFAWSNFVHLAAAHNGHFHQPENTETTHFEGFATGTSTLPFDCGVHHGHASSHFNSTIHELWKQPFDPTHGSQGNRIERDSQHIVVKAYFHVITKVQSAGSVTPAMVSGQLQALQTAYAAIGVRFDLADTSYTVNDAWAVGDGADLTALKTALRRGTYADLNLYFHTDLMGETLGTCSLPTLVPTGLDPQVYAIDGCHVNAGTMPGGPIVGYDQGMTAVHEVGHWLGLLHTFEGLDCNGDEDLIEDTRQESVSTQGCPEDSAKNSCPMFAGVDPIHNYMDYSSDACYTGFTPGQSQRIHTLWTQYRAPFVS